MMEQKRVSDEKDRRIVSDQIPISFFGIHLDRESSRIAHRIGRTTFGNDGRETNK